MDLLREIQKLSHPTYEIDGELHQWGIGGISHFLRFLGEPHLGYPVIHVAGTNGKGSVCCYIASALIQLGYKVGTYNSPHVNGYYERVKINGKNITPQYTQKFYLLYSSYIKQYPNSIRSYAEIFPALAFWYFKEENVDFGIIETGIGGLNDPTNVDCIKVLTIITSLGLDHTELFGADMARIIKEKTGICKPNIPLIIGNITNEWKDMLKSMIKDGVKLIDSSDYDFKFNEKEYDLSGAFIKQNLTMALLAIQYLNASVGIFYDKGKIEFGFKNAGNIMNYHGRWETISETPKVIIDVCGNALGLKEIFCKLTSMLHIGGYGRLIVLLGVSSKRKLDILDLLPKDAFYYFTEAYSFISGEEICKFSGKRGCVTKSVEEAIKIYLKEAKSDDLVFIGGSYWVAVEAYKHKSLFGKSSQNM